MCNLFVRRKEEREQAITITSFHYPSFRSKDKIIPNLERKWKLAWCSHKMRRVWTIYKPRWGSILKPNGNGIRGVSSQAFKLVIHLRIFQCTIHMYTVHGIVRLKTLRVVKISWCFQCLALSNMERSSESWSFNYTTKFSTFI